jgi:hypothetical protein
VENAMHALQEQDNCVQGTHLEDIDVSSSAPCKNRQVDELFTFDEDTISTILKHFDESSKLRLRWLNRDSSYLKGLIHNEIQGASLTHMELDIIYDIVRTKLPTCL